jgi:hypothetical protein
MALETGTYISDLNASNPITTDPRSEGDDHFRLIKNTIKNTFPNVTGAVTKTHTEINSLATAGPIGSSGITGAAASGANTDITSVAATTTINGTVIGYREVPQNTQSGNYTPALTDAGKHIYSANAGAQTLTLPTNATVAFPVGTAITIVNNGTTAITFTTTGTTVYKAGTSAAWASGGTLAVRGMVSVLKVATDTWFISGAGLS